MRKVLSVILLVLGLFQAASAQSVLQQRITTPDGAQLFAPGPDVAFTPERGDRSIPIVVDAREQYQEMLGFGFALTGGSAELLMKMSAPARHAILQEIFGTMDMGIIRLTVGASDMNSRVFTYDDMPKGRSDWELTRFSLADDLADVVPVMQEILKINPNVWVMASPWSAPAWMKEEFDVRGNKLRRECYDVYARYLARYIREMAALGIRIHALTIQNEPLNSRNTPSMPWSPADQLLFIRNYLGPEFARQGIDTQIILFDHNCDRPDYPLSILEDPVTAGYVCGSAFHQYMGDPSAMTLVHDFRPDKDIYFTEQMIVDRSGSVSALIAPSVKRMIVDIPRNWSRTVFLWNLAADPEANPHTGNGGCPFCFGAITLDGDNVTRNLAYYVVAHASAAVPAGSVRIRSTAPEDPASFLFEDEQAPGVMRLMRYDHSGVLPNVAFRTPDGRIVLIVSNTSSKQCQIKIQYKGEFADVYLPAGAVGTYQWKIN